MAEKISADELTQLLAGAEEVTVKSEIISVMPFKFGQLPAILRHIGALARFAEGDNFNIVRAITEGAEDVLACLAVATGKPREWFDTIEIDDGINLLKAVVNVNEEFFKKKLLPLVPSLGNLGKLAGQKSSRRSSR
jgi:hypothetical protein